MERAPQKLQWLQDARATILLESNVGLSSRDSALLSCYITTFHIIFQVNKIECEYFSIRFAVSEYTQVHHLQAYHNMFRYVF